MPIDRNDKIMNDSLRLIVVLATFNGGERLKRTLESYCQQSLPYHHWAMVIVNNASTDDTGQIIKSFEDKIPMLSLYHDVPGKNGCLNLAVDRILDTAANIVFTDDDALVEYKFLENWDNIISSKLDFDLFGGMVTPIFPSNSVSTVSDFSKYFDVLFAKNDRPDGIISAGDIYGPNMAVRRCIIDAGHRFDERIGPVSSDQNYAMGSETEFCLRVQSKTSCRSWFTRSTNVHHIVREEQTSRAYILERAQRHGRGYALRELLAGHPPAKKVKRPIRAMALSILRFVPIARFQWNWAWSKGYHDGLKSGPK